MREMVGERTEVLEIDLQKLLAAYFRKWWLILLCGFLAASGTLLYTAKCMTPLYRAGVTIYVNNTRSNQQIDYVSGGNLAASQKLVNTYVNIIKSDTVLEKVVEQSELDCSAAEIRSIMSAAQVEDTELFNVYIVHPDPEMAAEIANAVARVAPAEIEKIVEGSSTKIIDYAKIPASRFTPSYRKNTMIGGLVGCGLAIVYLTLTFLLDVRIKDDEDLTTLFDLPILGRIPHIQAAGASNRKKYGCETVPVTAGKGGQALMELTELFRRPPKQSSRQQESLRIQEERQCILSPESDFFIRESYKTLRTNVTFSLTGEGPSKVIVVTSSLQSEGKSLTAVNLALSFAETDKRVLLLECDMRRPKLGRLLDLSAPAGLSNLLLDPGLLDRSVIRRYGAIDIVLAGDVPPNPSELLGSSRMAKLLEQMKEKYDYIMLDTPPVNMVTDAVVLAPRSDGVLFVVRASQSERGAVAHAVEQLEYARVKILGFVFNGIDMETSSYGKYRYKRYGGCGYRSGYGRTPARPERDGP